MNYKERMIQRLDRRVETLKHRIERVKRRYINNLDYENTDAGEADRIWLDQFAKGNGLDICCGDFVIGDAWGVDGHETMIGTDYWSEGDELAFQEPGKLDFVVTNYLDGFANPLKALNEWYRCLKPGGTLAIVVRDADQYDGNYGPLENHKRGAVFTQKTLGFYLYRAGFGGLEISTTADKSLRAKAIKRE